MKPILASVILGASCLLPAAFAQQPPPAPYSDAPVTNAPVDAQSNHAMPATHAKPAPLVGTPEAAEAARADAERQSVETVAATTNGEPVAAQVAAVVESGKSYTTDDLIRAQRVAMGLDAGPARAAARTSANTTKTPGQTGVFNKAIATSTPDSLPASVTDTKIPAQQDQPTTAENTAKPDEQPEQ